MWSLYSWDFFAFSRFTSSSSYFYSYCSFISAYVRLLLLPAFMRWAPLPLLATDETQVNTALWIHHFRRSELTWDVDWVSEGSSNIRVKLNDKLSILCNLVVAFLDDFVNPVLELLAHQSVSHVHDEVARQSRKITLFRKIVDNLRMLLTLLENPFDT